MSASTPDKHHALALYQANRLPEAAAAFAAWCALHPEDAAAWSTLGIIHGTQGKWDDAERCCRKAIGADRGFVEAHVNLGVVLEAKGQLDAAVASYKEALKLNPQAQIHVNIGITLSAQGKRAEAIPHFRAALALKPNDADAQLALGTALEAEGELNEAEACYRAVLKNHPASAEALFNLGNVLLAAQRFSEAQSQYQQTLQLNPQHAGAHNNLGLTQAALSQFGPAEASHRNALKLNPKHAGAHKNLGLLLAQGGRRQEAGEHFQHSLALRPGQADVQLHLANLLAADDRLAEAVEHYRAALALKPDLTDAFVNLGGALLMLGRVDEAIAVYRSLLQYQPQWPQAYVYLGLALNSRGKPGEAAGSFRAALKLAPDSAEAHNYLGLALARSDKLDEAIASYREAIRLKPNYADAYNNLGGALAGRGDNSEAVTCHRKAVELKPDFVEAHSALLFAQLLEANYDGRAAFSECRNWNRLHAEPLRRLIRPHANDHAPQRRLRIGYVSDDLRDHVTNCFFEPVLEQHDPGQFEIFCYDTYPRPDAVTERLKRLAHHWRPIAGLSDNAVAEQIRTDAIDILVDLKGHTDNHRLLVFARKPAPLQVTWLGYPGTTGLDTTDYWISDRHIADAHMTDQFQSEQLLKLPDFYMVFRPKAGELPVGPLPALKNGHITFGSFNALAKIGPTVIALWAEVLKAVPGARLLMAAIPEGQARTRVRERFGSAGIPEERLILKGRAAHEDFLRLHNEVDIVLDAFPYNGTTTSLHDLWMGLPIVTLAGTFHASRVGVSLLANLGLPELIAQTPAEYVRIARDLAADIPRLSELRAGLRERMRASPLMDAARFTHNLEASYREIWRAWCTQSR